MPAVPGRAALFALAFGYPVLLLASFVLKPSVAEHAALWPPHALAFAAYRLLPLRYWPAVALLISAWDVVVMTLVHSATGTPPRIDRIFVMSMANALACTGMAAASGALRKHYQLRRGYMFMAPIWVIALSVGAIPGVAFAAWWHARGAHAPILPIDVLERLLSSVLTVVAWYPVMFGLTRGFREPGPPAAGRREAAGILLTCIVLGLGLLTVRRPLPDRFTELIVLVLPLFWLALRCSRRALDIAMAVIATFIAVASARGVGAFSPLAYAGSWTESIVSTQFYLLVACCEALLINRSILDRNALLEKNDRRQAQLAAYAQALDKADEIARRAAAADLHDGVGQILAGQGLMLGAMRRLSPDNSPVGAMLDQALAASREAQTAVRHTIQDLRPPEVDGATPSEILLSIAGMFDARYGFRVTWTVRGETDPSRLPGQLIYRIVRELIYNAYKHSKTDHATVLVTVRSEEIEARVVDGGAGFDARVQSVAGTHRFGLVSLGDRVRSAGGRLTVQSAIGKGCQATVCLPLLASLPTSVAESPPASTPSPSPDVAMPALDSAAEAAAGRRAH
jgi:signal transduction histidine kinase